MNTLLDSQVFRLVKQIAQRIGNPLDLKEALRSSNRNPSHTDAPWSPLTLSSGYPALVLLFVALDELFPSQGWDQSAHGYILAIKETLEAEGTMSLSLFGGLAGICFAVDLASKQRTRYQKLLLSLESFLIKETESSYFVPLREKIALGLPAHPELWEVISGVSGIGAYAVKNSGDPSMRTLSKEILQLVVALTGNIQIGPYSVPGWYHPRHYQFLEKDKELYPRGNFNIGMAHGVAGILAFLSIATLQGVIIEGQLEAMDRTSKWLLSKVREKQGRFFYENRIAFEEEVGIPFQKLEETPMDAWCYGTAGVARSLFLFAKATKNETVEEEAEKIFCFSSRLGTFSSPTFCHGAAGLLTLTFLMAQETHSSFLKQQVEILKENLLSFYCSESPFGFKDCEPILQTRFASDPTEGEWIELDKIGLLDGSVGALLALLSVETGYTAWCYPFLIQRAPTLSRS